MRRGLKQIKKKLEVSADLQLHENKRFFVSPKLSIWTVLVILRVIAGACWKYIPTPILQ